MGTQKMSFDVDEAAYMALKRDALENKTTMVRIIRNLLYSKYGDATNETEAIE